MLRRSSFTLATLVAAVFLACDRGEEAESASSEPIPSGGQTPDASDSPPAPVNLLKTVPTQVLVSTTSSPGMSGPSRMVDGRMDTAWNSETDDLVGAWFAVLLPDDVEVTSIKLVPGYIRNYQGKETFLANHRIKTLRVTRSGELVGEFSLDTELPELQELPVKGPGGMYKAEVLEVVAGTKSSWREVCITELQVWGQAKRRGPEKAIEPHARVVTLSGEKLDGVAAPRVSAKGLTKRKNLEFEPITLYLPEKPNPRSAEPLRRLLQGAWVSRVRPLELIELSGDDETKVYWALYYVDANAERYVKNRMALKSKVRGSDGGCTDDEAACPNLHLARVSVAATGLAPVVDTSFEVARDVCDHELRFDLRDLDKDGRDEVYARIDWETTPVCPVGSGFMEEELIVDLDGVELQYSATLKQNPGGSFSGKLEGNRVVRDFNEDGHPDFLLRFRHEEPAELEDDEIVPGAVRFEERQLIYDVAADRWIETPTKAE